MSAQCPCCLNWRRSIMNRATCPLSGKRGKQDGVWLSAAILRMARCDGKPSAIRGCLPRATISNKAIQAMFMALGGPMVFMQLLASKPDVAMELMEVYGVDADTFDDEYAATTIPVPQATGSGVRRRRKKRSQYCCKRSRWPPLRRW